MPRRLWRVQVEAITNLERSLADNRPRALNQMATGSGKTYTAVNMTYRVVKYGGAKRVLFLVDRGNLGRQTHKEFQQFVSPASGYKFTDEFNVQLLRSNTIDPVSRVCITTIQRLYSMLKGEPEFAEENEEGSLFETEIRWSRSRCRSSTTRPSRSRRLTSSSSTNAIGASTTSGGRYWNTSMPS